MKGLLGREEETEEEEELKESPAVIEGVEENEESLNIKINKRKMFTKPPTVP